MQVRKTFALSIAIFAFLAVSLKSINAAPRKVHVVSLGAVKRVPYSKSGDPSGAAPDEVSLKIRPLIVDGLVKDWTAGEAHDITDRSFVVRRVIRINDQLPGEKAANPEKHWVWQRGPWVLVDRVSGHIAALKLPDYDPGISQVVWFRDYGAYCGITSSGKSLYAVVAQVSARKPLLAKKLSALNLASLTGPACEVAEWQRDPLRTTFHPSGKDPVSFEIIPGSAVLVEDSDDEGEAGKKSATGDRQ